MIMPIHFLTNRKKVMTILRLPRKKDKAIYLIGMEFNPEDKNIESFEWQQM